MTYYLVVQKIANDLEVIICLMQIILMDDFKVHNMIVKLVTKLLSDKQKQLDVVQEILLTEENDLNFFKTIITGYET